MCVKKNNKNKRFLETSSVIDFLCLKKMNRYIFFPDTVPTPSTCKTIKHQETRLRTENQPNCALEFGFVCQKGIYLNKTFITAMFLKDKVSLKGWFNAF